jgi:predicted secreted protein
MLRNKKLIILSHCILNQNTVIKGWERSTSSFKELVLGIIDKDISIIQLPCPEFGYLGLDRPPMTKEQYDTDDHRSFCQSLLSSTVNEIDMYHKSGHQILGIVGIHQSPSCSITNPRGVMMEEFIKSLGGRSISLPFIEVPEDYGTNQETTLLFNITYNQFLKGEK